MKYDKLNHSKFLLMYHIIFVCKYKRKALSGLEIELKNTLYDIASNWDFDILEMEYDQDHIHLLVKSYPKISILSIIRKLKQESTYRMWKHHEKHLRKYYWKERTLWSDGYFCSTIGNVSKELVTEYIQNQG
jgi:putative transposase